MRSLALAACVGVAGVALALPRGARADEPPSAERLRSAAGEYDAGRRAFGERDYEGAATHFENAFNDAANALALRNAILARKKAGQLARAATLASLASSLYPTDSRTMASVHEVLSEARPKLDRVTLHCSTPCGVAADGRAISPADAAVTVFYLEPGSHELVVSWGESRSKNATVVAVAGGQEELTYEAPPAAGGGGPARFTGVDNPPPPPPPPAPQPSGITPIVFYSGVAATAISLGVTIWSGIDTENNPGTTAVKAACQPSSANATCQNLYNQGRSSQLRTNALIGVTSGLGAITAVVAAFTRWSGGDEKPPPKVESLIAPLPTGGVVGVQGRF